MKVNHRLFTPPRLIFTLLLALSVFTGCQVESDDEPEKNTFTVTFNANGGSGEMKALTAEEGTEITLTANAFTRDGYTFSGWATSASGNIVHTDGAKIKPTANITLYAQWTEIGKVEKVTFSATGEIDYNERITLSCGTDGATIYYAVVAGTDAPTTEEFSSSKQKYSEPLAITENAVIAAVAVKDGLRDSEIATATFTVKTYTVTFETEYGTAPAKIEGLKKGDRLTEEQLKALEDVTGYKFDGWFSGETQFTTETEITSDITLTAKWTKTYTLTFDANGGTGEMNQQTAESGTEIELPESTFTRDGYIFAGWATSADGDVSYSDKAKITVSGNITLYAKWGMTAANAAAAIADLTEEGSHTVTVAGEIGSDDMTELAKAISGRAENVKVILDLGGATGLTEIPEDFMSNQDENLAGLVIPASVTEIKSNFWSCSNLSVLKVAENNPAYKSVDNIIYTKDGQTLVLAARTLTEATIPANVVTIGIYAFQTCEKLQKVTFEQGSVLETIEDYAFSDCNELTEITLPSTLRTLGEDVFNCCFELKSITLPEGIKTIPAGAFINCTSLAEISLPSTLETIENFAFCNMGLSTVKYNGIKSGWENIQKKGNNKALDNAALICLGSDPKEVYTPADKAAAAIATLEEKDEIDSYVIKITNGYLDTEELKKIGELIKSKRLYITLDLSSAAELKEIPESAFASSQLKGIVLPNSLETIGTGAFRVNYFEEIVIPDKVISIEDGVFYGCYFLKTITLPASLPLIGASAFADCDSLETVNYKGTQEQWEALKTNISTTGNDKLTGANIVYEYTGE